ncbi:iron dicitrate transport regulator FecR [Brenneria roseae subsp. roseae]|uniref:FecR family protein n=1 Tax=Brenneria roseae TaxID=1509241 RepID=UPI000D613F53|nr:FecR family protein [Brenneria roseae]PWC18317.1 iron dicitrate transport regulator FecR [Brenneria roseae subsp. roseae]
MKDYPPEIRQQAALWAIRLAEAPLEDEQEQAFQHWLQQDPRHTLALQQAGTLWQELGSLSTEQKQALQPRVTPIKRFAHWRIAALLLLGLSVGTAWFSDGFLMLRADYRAENQVRSVTLPDGSQVEMDAGSAIAIAYNQHERRIKLLQGNAWFTAAPVNTLEPRPFLVDAASGTTQALGTQFIIQNTPQVTTVGVIEHSVQVTANGQTLRLDEQQAARYTPHGVTRDPDWNSRDSSDWKRGQLVFNQQPLSDVVDRINRYHTGTVIVSGTALRQSQVSGIFSLNELDSALKTITAELGAKTVTLPGVTILY